MSPHTFLANLRSRLMAEMQPTPFSRSRINATHECTWILANLLSFFHPSFSLKGFLLFSVWLFTGGGTCWQRQWHVMRLSYNSDVGNVLMTYHTPLRWQSVFTSVLQTRFRWSVYGAVKPACLCLSVCLSACLSVCLSV